MTAPALTLYPYQRRWVQDRARFKIGCFARQTGKTFTTTLEIVDDCFTAAAQGRRSRWVILSRGERQAREAMETGVKPHAKAYGAAIEELEYDLAIDAAAGATFRALEVELPGGSRITALPANPDTARGFSASVFLDEFAFHKDSRAIWRALFPVISAGHKIRITSTPNGRGNMFYDLFTGRNDIWSRHRVTIHDAVADGLPRDIEQLKRAIADDDAWWQEFELEWLDEASAWLPYELIFSCEDADAGDPAQYRGGLTYIGCDIAARADLWVAWVAELVGDVLWTREVVALKRASFAKQNAVLDELMHRYHVARLAMDQTGMGEKPVEDARRRYGAARVEGVLFTGPAKLDLASKGKQRFEDRRIRIPEGDPALRADLHSLVKSVNETGLLRFLAPREGGSHADRTWACFLACHAASVGVQEYGYESARTRGDGGLDFRRPHNVDLPLRRGRTSGLARMRGAV